MNELTVLNKERESMMKADWGCWAAAALLAGALAGSAAAAAGSISEAPPLTARAGLSAWADSRSASADGQARMSGEGKGADVLDSLGHAARAPAAGAEADKPAGLERRTPPGAGRATYRQAALRLDPAAYDLELPSRIAGCPDFYFPDAPRNPGGCGTLDGHCVACWDRPYQGETARNGLKKEEG